MDVSKAHQCRNLAGRASSQTEPTLHIPGKMLFLINKHFTHLIYFTFVFPARKIYIKQQQRLKTHAIYIKEVNKTSNS